MTSDHDTTVAILTPPGRGAVAVVSVEGPRALLLVEGLFQPHRPPPLAERAPGAIIYGAWGGNPPEDVVVSIRAPNRVEVHCHGGAAASARIAAGLVQQGARQISWQASLSRREPRAIAAEARIALAAAATRRAAAVLLDQYHGALDAAGERAIRLLQQGDLDAAANALDLLKRRAPLGLHLAHPWRVVVAGPPNVGKSSLVNTLLGYARAIVFDQPGTTRDVVTAATAFDGWPVELVDTAGLRPTEDELEAAGVRRAGEEILGADLVLLLFDRSQPWSPSCQRLCDRWPSALVVQNKADLPAAAGDAPRPGLSLSAATGQGTQELMAAIASRLVPEAPAAGAAVPFTPRQAALIDEAASAVAGNDAPAAIERLLALVRPEAST